MPSCFLFFFNDTATTEIYTLSLHDALPIFTGVALGLLTGTSPLWAAVVVAVLGAALIEVIRERGHTNGDVALALLFRSEDTRLNSSHANISYAVFCLKKKKTAENASNT